MMTGWRISSTRRPHRRGRCIIGKPKAPKSPDPVATAAAQTGTNVTTALANAQLNNVNQYGPDGSVTYTTSGGQNFTDPSTGKTYYVPQYNQYTSLSPQQQAIKDQSDAAELNLGKTANQQSAFLQDYLGKPVDLSNSAVDQYINDHYTDDFNKQQNQQQTTLQTNLSNQGVKLGSAAYTNAMNDFSTARASAYDNLYGNQRQNAISTILAQRNQPLNEITALLGGSQVQTPTFGAGTNQGSIPTTDYAGIVNQNYQNQLGAYNTKMGQYNSVVGGLFGLGGKLIGLSDERAKKNIKPVGKLMGNKLYEYEYKDGFGQAKGKRIGVLAQEAEKKNPDAVIMGNDGYRRVDYGRLFLGENA